MRVFRQQTLLILGREALRRSVTAFLVYFIVLLSTESAEEPQFGMASILPAFVPADFGYINDRAWNQAQDAFARLVPNTQHIVVTGSDHNIQIDHPQAVINAIRYVVDRVRNAPDPPGLSFTHQPNPTLDTMPTEDTIEC